MNSAERELELLRTAFQGGASVREVAMFGGTAFLVNGHMTIALSPRGLLVRVGPDEHDNALQKPGTRAMEMRGRVMTGYIFVDPAPSDARVLNSWVQAALRHNRTLPPKKPTAATRKKQKTKTQRRTRS
jgi:TfoX/Sxy family transcriptional regulator of competence genes